MKRIALTLLICSAIFAACKKSNSSKPATVGISCDINGQAETFNGSVNVDTTGGQVAVLASQDSLNAWPALEFVIAPAGPLTVGIYPAQNLVNPNQSSSVFSYVAPATTQFESTDQFVSADDTITVTSVTSTTVSGTFHGTALFQYYNPILENSVDSTVTITNGKFTINL
jgi:hypothetical protein